MRFPPLIVLFLATGFVGCTVSRENMAWPKPRPLGQDIPAFQAPTTPKKNKPSLLLKEPTGALSLKKALTLALIHNPELKTFSWAMRAREAGVLQSGLLPNPELDISLENIAGSGPFDGTDQAETTIQLSQLIELGGKRAARKQSAMLEQNLSGWDYEIKRMEIFTQVSKRFTTALGAQERLLLMEEVLKIGDQVVETVSARVKAGKASPVEETKVKVTLASLEIKLGRAKRDVMLSQKNLSATWGSSDPRFERVVGTLNTASEIPSIETLVEALNQNPELARWAVEISTRETAVLLEKSKALPDLTLSGGLRRLNGSDDDAFVFGLSFPLPLFNRNQGNTLEARHELAMAEEARRAAAIRINTELNAVYNTLASAQAELKALHQNVLPGANRAFEAVNEGYRLGKFSLMDVLDAQRTISDAKAQYLDALTAYHMALADLEHLIGVSLSSETDNTDKKNLEMKKKEGAR